MAEIRSYFEMTPAELLSRPSIRNFGPFEKVRYVRFAWFCWFWLGNARDSLHTVAVGPFKTRWGARRAWDKVNKLPTFDSGDPWGTRPGTRALQSKFPN